MTKFNLCGSVEDEFVKIASERGWVIKEELSSTEQTPPEKNITTNNKISKEALMPLTPQQESVIKSIMQLRKVDFNTALDYAKNKYPRVFSEKPVPDPKPKDPWAEWAESMPSLESDWLESVKRAPEVATEKAMKEIEEAEAGRPGVIQWANDITSAVINELVSLANDLEKMGEDGVAIAVDKQIKIYKEAADKFYDVTGETGEDLINQAHPGGGPTIAPSKEEGGKVETIVEEQKKSIDKATKAPTGKYAEVIHKLVTTANKLEKDGEVGAAKIVDKTIEKLRQAVLPFVNRSAALEAADSEENEASVKRNLINATYKLYKKLLNLRDKIDRGDSGNKMKAMINAVMLSTATLSRNKNKWSLSDIAKQVRSIAQIITKGDVDVEDALGSWDKNDYWPVEKYARYLENLAQNVLEKEFSSKWSPIKKSFFDKYLDTLNSVTNVLKNNPEKAAQAFGSANAAEEVLEALDKEKNIAKKYTPTQLRNAKKMLVERLVPHLKKWKINVGVTATIINDKIIKEAKTLGEILRNLPEPKKEKPVKTITRRTPRRKGDKNIEKLQSALLRAGFVEGPPEKFIDGIWGKNTSAAYNMMLETAQRYMGGRSINLEPKGPRDVPSFNEIKRAIRVANFISSRNREILSRVEFTIQGQKFDSRDLENTKTFLDALDRAGLIVSDWQKLDKEKIIDIVNKNLRILISDLKGSLGDAIRINYGPGAVGALLNQIRTLWVSFNSKGWLPSKITEPETMKEMPFGMKGKEDPKPGVKPRLTGLETEEGKNLAKIYNDAVKLNVYRRDKNPRNKNHINRLLRQTNMKPQEFLLFLDNKLNNIEKSLREVPKQQAVNAGMGREWMDIAKFVKNFGDWLDQVKDTMGLTYSSKPVPKPIPKPTSKPVPPKVPTTQTDRYVFSESTATGDIFWDRVRKEYVWKKPGVGMVALPPR